MRKTHHLLVVDVDVDVVPVAAVVELVTHLLHRRRALNLLHRHHHFRNRRFEGNCVLVYVVVAVGAVHETHLLKGRYWRCHRLGLLRKRGERGIWI